MSGWSAQQAHWLRALGHPVLVRREADWPAGAVRAAAAADRAHGQASPAERPAPVTSPAAAPVAAAQGGSARPARRDAPPRPDTGPSVVPQGAPATASTAAPRTDTSAKLVALSQARRERDFGNPRFAPLLEQLLRAAGLEGEAGRERLRALEVDLALLHRDPSAKRALWPALRALRRGQRQ